MRVWRQKKKSLRFLTLALQNAECVNHHNAPNSVIPLGQLETLMTVEHAIPQKNDAIDERHAYGNLACVLTRSENSALGALSPIEKMDRIHNTPENKTDITRVAGVPRCYRLYGALARAQVLDAVAESGTLVKLAGELQLQAEQLGNLTRGDEQARLGVQKLELSAANFKNFVTCADEAETAADEAVTAAGKAEPVAYKLHRATFGQPQLDESFDLRAAFWAKAKALAQALETARKAVDAADKAIDDVVSSVVSPEGSPKTRLAETIIAKAAEKFVDVLNLASDAPLADRINGLDATNPALRTEHFVTAQKNAIGDETRLALLTLGKLLDLPKVKVWHKGTQGVHINKACGRYHENRKLIGFAGVLKICGKCVKTPILPPAQSVQRLVLAFEEAESKAAPENDGAAYFAKNLKLLSGTQPEDVEILRCAVRAGHLPHLEAVIAGDGVEPELLQPICDALKARSEQRNAANSAQVPSTPPRSNSQAGNDSIINVTP
eukprot:TRINITY_DN3920_c1_g1_i2.p1 TRINITY_DN3920_c1_g1~~TRINITY_DN3920_c1_g1_i2.p1  ORF type:complete len:495 (+),score=29.30 TRINITY_DN3920_c1_g1_i2:541-2025(+)